MPKKVRDEGHIIVAAAVLSFTTGPANADLIFLGADSLAGQGIGDTVLTLRAPGEDSLNEPHAASALGLTDFADLRILFSASEPDSDITLTGLSLRLSDPFSGLMLDTYSIPGAVVFADTDPGVGNAGFFFGLDAAQAAQANLLLADFPDLFLGRGAAASDSTGGSETFSFGVARDDLAVPEPMTLTLLGFGLAGLGWLSRKRSI